MRKKIFGKRIVSVYVMLVIITFGAVLRIFAINSDGNVKISSAQNKYRLKLADLRCTVFDKNMSPITNDKEKIMAVVYPLPRAVTAVSSLLTGEETANFKKMLSSGKPVVIDLPKAVKCDGVYCFKVKINEASNIACPQLIGYCDNTAHGVSGIQKAYDDELYIGEMSALVSVDGFGNILLGTEPELSNDLSNYNSGIILTLDKSIQSAVENSMKNIKSGAAIVSEIGTGKIRAMVSKPEFNPENISASLSDEDSPFLNRGLSLFNVGSVFKPIVAAAVLQTNNSQNFSVYCSGKTEIAGHTFACHKLSGHGLVDIKKALSESCNVFFYNIAQNIGAKNILQTASAFGLANSVDIGGIYARAGNLPDISKNLSPRDIANLAIGQGELLLSPVSMLCVYEAIANGGIYNIPTVIEGKVKNGVITREKTVAPTRAISEKTAETLKDYLKNVVENGTGKAAKPETVMAAGKTATAQTGWQKNGKFTENSWFCGFFPADNPKYAVVVMIDDIEKNGTTASPIFKNIADGISLFENSRNKAIN